MLTLPLLVIPALFFVGMGVIGLVRPAFIANIFGGKVETAPSRAEVRAVYGGYGVVMGALLLGAPTLMPDVARGIALAMAASVGAMALGRTVSAIVERQGGWYPTWFFLGVELLLAASLAIWAW